MRIGKLWETFDIFRLRYSLYAFWKDFGRKMAAFGRFFKLAKEGTFYYIIGGQT